MVKARPDLDDILTGDAENVACPMCGFPVTSANAGEHIDNHFGDSLPDKKEVGKRAEWYRQLVKISKQGGD